MVERSEILDKVSSIQCVINDIVALMGSYDGMSDTHTQLQIQLESMQELYKYYDYIADNLRGCTAYNEEEFAEYAKDVLDTELANAGWDYQRLTNYLTVDYDAYARDLSTDYTVIDIDGIEYYLV